jgi:hypothetical protein
MLIVGSIGERNYRTTRESATMRSYQFRLALFQLLAEWQAGHHESASIVATVTWLRAIIAKLDNETVNL